MSQPPPRLPLLAAVAALTLHACGTVVAPDALLENPGAEAFLDRVGSHCGKLSIGNQTLGYLLDENSDDTYLVDESSKLYFGDVSRATFANDINSFYPTGENQPALDCLFAQLGER